MNEYLRGKEEIVEYRVKFSQCQYQQNMILDMSFRYNEIQLQDWSTMRLTIDLSTFTPKNPEGYKDRILFGCEVYNG